MKTADNDPNVPRALDAKTITIEGVEYERIPIKSRLIGFGEKLETVLNENVKPFWKEGDWVVLSQKLVAVCGNNVRHISTVKVSWLARFIVKGVKKHKNMTAWSRPEKMQLAIEIAGVWRIIPAMVIGAFGKLIGVRGLFWIIAGNHVSEIDGFIPEDMYPYTEYAVLPPPHPQNICEEVEKNTGMSAVLVDANFINVEVLGVSNGVGLDKKTIRKILLDNPLGQGNKMTPFVLVRKINKDK